MKLAFEFGVFARLTWLTLAIGVRNLAASVSIQLSRDDNTVSNILLTCSGRSQGRNRFLIHPEYIISRFVLLLSAITQDILIDINWALAQPHKECAS
jgi:hypothetical protein